MGLPGVWLSLYPQTGWAPATGRSLSRTGRRGAGHVSLVDRRTTDHAPDCQTVERAEDAYADGAEPCVACGECALYAQQPHLYRAGVLQSHQVGRAAEGDSTKISPPRGQLCPGATSPRG